MPAKLNIRALSYTLIVLYAIELLDELIYGLQGAALPLIKNDLALSYTQVGLLVTIPGLVSIAIEPFIGLAGDTRLRRVLVLAGISATTGSLVLVAFGQSFATLLIAICFSLVASGAYVNLAQATLIDVNPARAEQTMARWTLLGALGITIAPIVATVAFAYGLNWRGLYLAFASLAGIYIGLIWRIRFDTHVGALEESFAPHQLLRDLVAALRNAELLRWVLLTEFADLMLDKLYEVVGLYFHDVVGVSFAEASAASATFAIAGLIGSIALVPLLERVNGLRVLRLSSIAVLFLYAAFLLAPYVWLKYVLIAALSLGTAGWFAILRGKTYAALPGQSGMVVAITAFANVSALFVPLIVGRIADAAGLNVAMWVLIGGPLALIVGLPRGRG